MRFGARRSMPLRPCGKKGYQFSLARWHSISTEKEKARAKASASHSDSLLKTATIIITKQNRLTTTVKAFFSDRYFFIKMVLSVWGYRYGKNKEVVEKLQPCSVNSLFLATKVLLNAITASFNNKKGQRIRMFQNPFYKME
jgi:ribosomal protein L17